MATDAQIEANRRNAQKSTGPRTEAGKARSRQNAMKHGLAALELLPEHDLKAVQDRIDQWDSSLKPSDVWETWCLGLMAVTSLRVERCFREENAIRAEAATRAERCWDDERRLEAEELGRRLSRDPGATKLKLERTPQGCRWLAARWREVIASAESPDGQAPASIDRAFDLLGVSPEGRQSPPPDLAATAREEIDRLEHRADEVLADLDDAERDLAECGLGPQAEKAVRLIRRYESACLRRLEWARKQIGKVLKPYVPKPDPPLLPPWYPARPEKHEAEPAPNGPNPAPAAAAAPNGANSPPAAAPNEADRPAAVTPKEANSPPSAARLAPPSGPGTLAGSVRDQLIGRLPAPNRRSRRAARSRAA